MKQQKGIALITILVMVALATILAASIAKRQYAANENTQPNIYGKSAITLDMDTGEIIYAKSPDDKMYPASTTKLITSLLLAENKSKDDDLTYTKDAKAQPEYSLNKNLHPIPLNDETSRNLSFA